MMFSLNTFLKTICVILLGCSPFLAYIASSSPIQKQPGKSKNLPAVNRGTLPSGVQRPKSNLLTKGLGKTKQKCSIAFLNNRFLSKRLRMKFQDFRNIPQDVLFEIINTPHLLRLLNAEQLQSIPDHLILKMNFSMKRKLSGQMFRQGLDTRGKLVLYRAHLNIWPLNAMKEFINNPIKTQADLDSFFQRWEGRILSTLYEDEGFFMLNESPGWTVLPGGIIEFPPEFKQALLEEVAKRGLLPNKTEGLYTRQIRNTKGESQ